MGYSVSLALSSTWMILIQKCEGNLYVLLLRSLSSFSFLYFPAFPTVFQQLVSKKKKKKTAPTNKVWCLLNLVCFKLISSCHLLNPFPPVTFLFPLGSQETILPFLNTTRTRRSVHDVFHRHDLLARALEEGIVISILQDKC